MGLLGGAGTELRGPRGDRLIVIHGLGGHRQVDARRPLPGAPADGGGARPGDRSRYGACRRRSGRGRGEAGGGEAAGRAAAGRDGAAVSGGASAGARGRHADLSAARQPGGQPGRRGAAARPGPRQGAGRSRVDGRGGFSGDRDQPPGSAAAPGPLRALQPGPRRAVAVGVPEAPPARPRRPGQPGRAGVGGRCGIWADIRRHWSSGAAICAGIRTERGDCSPRWPNRWTALREGSPPSWSAAGAC
jgi:hypothetical protein